MRGQRRGPRYVKYPTQGGKNGRVRYRRTDLESFIEANVVETTSG